MYIYTALPQLLIDPQNMQFFVNGSWRELKTEDIGGAAGTTSLPGVPEENLSDVDALNCPQINIIPVQNPMLLLSQQTPEHQAKRNRNRADAHCGSIMLYIKKGGLFLFLLSGSFIYQYASFMLKNKFKKGVKVH